MQQVYHQNAKNQDKMAHSHVLPSNIYKRSALNDSLQNITKNPLPPLKSNPFSDDLFGFAFRDPSGEWWGEDFASGSAAKSRPLGMNTNLRARFNKENGSQPNDTKGLSDKKSNDKNSVPAEDSKDDPRDYWRKLKYERQEIAASILAKEMVNRKGVDRHVHRVCNCLKQRISAEDNVFVFYNPNRDRAEYANVQRCGGVWTCPVCAGKITESRRFELRDATGAWRAAGGGIVMLTLTIPHYKHDSLASLNEKFSDAQKRFWRNGSVQRYMKSLAFRGQHFGRISSLEVTHGENGWHPHAHILLFIRDGADAKQIQDHLAKHWQKACVAAGLREPTLKHGLNVQDAQYAEEYINKYGQREEKRKWGIESELSKGHTKKGRKSSVTPFQILDLAKEDADSGFTLAKGKYHALFTEFANEFKGRTQIKWSRGLRDLIKELAAECNFELEVLNGEEKSDDEIVSETDKASVLATDIEPPIWGLILRQKARPEVLRAVETDVRNGIIIDAIITDPSRSEYLSLLDRLAVKEAEMMAKRTPEENEKILFEERRLVCY